MARARNPNRDKAFEIYSKSNGDIKLKDIAIQLNIPDSRIRKWKTEDKWDEKIKERSDSAKGALLLDKGSEKEQKRKPGGQQGNNNAAKPHGFGNKNAVGNDGGAPKRNTNAVKTGEFQTIWLDYLSDEERQFYDSIDTDKLRQVNEDIRLLTWRENMMMKRIHELRDGIDNIEVDTTEEAEVKRVPVEVYDEQLGKMVLKVGFTREIKVTEVKTKQKSMLAEILRIEEALTRVQDKKAKLVQLKHKIEVDYERLELERKRVEMLVKNSGELSDEKEDEEAVFSYLEALNSQAKMVWKDDD